MTPDDAIPPPARHRMIERLPLARDQRWVGYVVAVILAALALFARLAIDPLLPTGYPFLTFFPVVVICAFLFGRGPGIACALVSGVAAWLVILTPHGALGLDNGNALALAFYGCTTGVQIFLVDLSQRFAHEVMRERETNRQLADTRQLLFRELQHRVSNNLQVIGALLSAQRRRVTDPVARSAIEEAANRLTVIGQICRELYLPDGGRADMDDFLARLVNAVLEASGRSDIICDLSIPPNVALEPDRAIPLALVMTEAVSNALEHGLPDRAGRVSVTLSEAVDGHLILTVDDDGRGLPDGFDIHATDQLGLRIAGQLAQQLGGSFDLLPRSDGVGTRAILTVRC